METYSKEIFTPEYIIAIKNISDELIKNPSPAKLKSLRDPLIKLLVNGVQVDMIILNIVKEISTKIKNNEVMRQIIDWASFYDNRAQNGSKSIFHLEALFARIMLIIEENNIK